MKTLRQWLHASTLPAGLSITHVAGKVNKLGLLSPICNIISILNLVRGSMYRQKKYKSDNFIEYEIRHKGQYGAKGEKRAPKKKATSEQIKKQNLRNKINRIRRTLQLNFYPNDIWLTLKYPKGTRKSLEEVKKDMTKFQNGLRKDYKLRGEQFKWIRRIEIGRNGGIHAHYVINRIFGSELLIQKNWPDGFVNFTNIRGDEGMAALAEYIAKPIPEEVKQISFDFIEPEDIKRCMDVQTSRNLIRPDPEVKEYKRKTVRKLLTGDIEPTEGYYVDKDSIQFGVNPITGYSYLTYRELRIKPISRIIKPPPEGRMRC